MECNFWVSQRESGATGTFRHESHGTVRRIEV
jgi:hypothetical protein